MFYEGYLSVILWSNDVNRRDSHFVAQTTVEVEQSAPRANKKYRLCVDSTSDHRQSSDLAYDLLWDRRVSRQTKCPVFATTSTQLHRNKSVLYKEILMVFLLIAVCGLSILNGIIYFCFLKIINERGTRLSDIHRLIYLNDSLSQKDNKAGMTTGTRLHERLNKEHLEKRKKLFALSFFRRNCFCCSRLFVLISFCCSLECLLIPFLRWESFSHWNRIPFVVFSLVM